jgi:hypothetical protein
MLKRAMRVSAILLVAWLPGLPQFEMRRVTGVVTDKRGNALSHATVQLEDTVTLSVRSYITGKDGHYHFGRLYDDVDYTLRAEYRNHWSARKTLSKFNSSKHPEVDLIIPID